MGLKNGEQQLSSCKLQRRRQRRPMQCLSILSSLFFIILAIKHNLAFFVTSFQFQRPSLHTHTGYNTLFIGGCRHNNNHDRIRRRRLPTTSSFFILNELPSPSSKYLDHLCNVGVSICVTFVLCYLLYIIILYIILCHISYHEMYMYVFASFMVFLH